MEGRHEGVPAKIVVATNIVLVNLIEQK